MNTGATVSSCRGQASQYRQRNLGRRLWAAVGAHEAAASLAGQTHCSEKSSLAAGRGGTGLQQLSLLQTSLEQQFHMLQLGKKKKSESHSSISTQIPGASHEVMLRQQSRLGTGRSNSGSVSLHSLLPAPRSPLEGLLARHVNKTFKFRKFSSLGLLTLLMEVAQNTEALNIS